MFSTNNYLLPQYFSSSSSSSPSSLYPRPNASLVDLNSVEFLFHHHPEMFSGHYLAAAAHAPPFIHAAALLNQGDSGTINGEAPSATTVTASSLQRKQPVKKDRHSKIFTAQGPRDRRVRLSIGIARKFFDLQEMLGFDKPSKTLDWLLTKSKAAIKELVQMKENASCANKSASSPSECELISSESNGEAFEIGADTKKKFVKESRAKARARARERTKEKMSIKNNMGSDDLNPLSVPIQYRNNQVDLFQSSAAGAQDLIQESIVVKRKMKSPSFFGFQQNVFVSRDSSSNYGVPSANNAPENWDICSLTSQSNLCATLDQHKFINSSSNM